MIKHTLVLMLATLLLGLLGCQGTPLAPVTPSPTPTPTPTATVLATATPSMAPPLFSSTLTLTCTPTSTPDMKRHIMFSGYPCDPVDICIPGSDYPGPWENNIYTIDSDGTHLQIVEAGNIPEILAQSPDKTRLLLRDYREDTNGDGKTNYLDRPQLFIFDLSTTSMQLLASNFSEAEWLPDSDHLMLKGYRDLYIARYTGTDREIILETDLPPRSWFHSTLSPDASQVAYITCAFGEKQCTLYLINIDGSNQRTVAIFSRDSKSAYVNWSAEGEWLGVSVPSLGMRKQVDIFAVKANGSELHKVYHSSDGLVRMRWLPEEQTLIFATGAKENFCFKADVDGTNLEELPPMEGLGICIRGKWSPDGKLFVTTSAGNWRSEDSTVIEHSGLYIWNSTNKKWQQILSGYSINGLAWLP